MGPHWAIFLRSFLHLGHYRKSRRPNLAEIDLGDIRQEPFNLKDFYIR